MTGANSGIGAAVAKELAMAGAKVVVNYVSGEEMAKKVVEEIKDGGGEAIAIKADVSQESEVQEMFRRMNETYGSIDILVNNAGLQKDAPFHEMRLEDWNFVLSVNLTGQFLCSREAVREFMRRGVVPELSIAVTL
mgnify:FL=1